MAGQLGAWHAACLKIVIFISGLEPEPDRKRSMPALAGVDAEGATAPETLRQKDRPDQ
jgi:hypothetical protein